MKFVFSGEKPHQCDICKKRFSSTSNLKTHLRLHSGQKPYACDLCPAKFTQFVHLKLHKRLHTNERPYTCQGCSKKYISASGLRWVQEHVRPRQLAVTWKNQFKRIIYFRVFKKKDEWAHQWRKEKWVKGVGLKRGMYREDFF